MAKKKEDIVVNAEPVEEAVVEISEEEASKERFVMRKLAVINKMPNRAMAERLAARVLMNNRKG